MKKIMLAIALIILVSVFCYAESCKGSGLEKEYKSDEGNCTYQMRTCCDDGTWSGWDKDCPSKEEGCDINDLPSYEPKSPNYDPMERQEQATYMCKVAYCDICWETTCNEKTKHWETNWIKNGCIKCRNGRFFYAGRCLLEGGYTEEYDDVNDYVSQMDKGCPSTPTKASKLAGCYTAGGRENADSYCGTYTGTGPCGFYEDWVLQVEHYKDVESYGYNSTIYDGPYYECGWRRKYYTCTGYSGE